MILLDTHVWLWWLLGDGPLSNRQREGLDRLASQHLLALSWVSIWECEMLERKQRILLQPNFQEWIREATSSEFLNLWPVDLDVVIAQRELPQAFHNDPADRLITASAFLADVPLATLDQRIINSGFVEIWTA